MPKPKQPFVIRRSADDKWYVVYLANNGRVLAQSETFNDSDAPVNNINAMAGVFLQNHPKVEDLAKTIHDWWENPDEENNRSYEELAQYILDKHHSVQDDLYLFIKREKRRRATKG